MIFFITLLSTMVLAQSILTCEKKSDCPHGHICAVKMSNLKGDCYPNHDIAAENEPCEESGTSLWNQCGHGLVCLRFSEHGAQCAKPSDIYKAKEGEECLNASWAVCDTGLVCRKVSTTQNKCFPFTTPVVTSAVSTTPAATTPSASSSSSPRSSVISSSATYLSTATAKPTDVPINNAQSLGMMSALGVFSFLFFL